MRVAAITHVPFEGLSLLKNYLDQNRLHLKEFPLYLDSELPKIDEFDWLIIMGGPMSIYDDHLYPYLSSERNLILNAIQQKKIVTGICLGAQFIADALGKRVFKNPHKEIGWHDIILTPEVQKILEIEHRILKAFHWHGDTFDLPENAIPIGSSEATACQGFIYEDRVLSLQFHVEMQQKEIEIIYENCAEEVVNGKYITPLNSFLPDDEIWEMNQGILFRLLNFISRQENNK